MNIKQIQKKIMKTRFMKSKFMKELNKGMDKINKFTTAKEDWGVNIKKHTIQRKWSPKEMTFLELTAGD